MADRKKIASQYGLFYMRNLKALWNRAVNDGIIEARPSPFRHINTGIGKSTKRAVDKNVILSIEKLDSKNYLKR